VKRLTPNFASLVFTLVVVANFVAMGIGSEATWVGLLAIPPHLVLLATGPYLFVLPYRRAASD
jgi:hypothetical protein